MAIWVKENGVELEVHPNSEEYAASIGWKRKGAKKSAPKKADKK